MEYVVVIAMAVLFLHFVLVGGWPDDHINDAEDE